MIYGNHILGQWTERFIKGGNPSIQPASIDLTLGDCPQRILHPGQFLLAATAEHVTVPMLSEHKEWFTIAPLPWHDANLVHVVGKSTLARRGLIVESAGLVDPGWEGVLTLELYNLGPAAIELTPGMPICQITVQAVVGCTEGYKGRYQGATSWEDAK